MNAPSPTETRALATVQSSGYSMAPRNFEEAWRLADIMANSGLVPKEYEKNPEKCFVAMQWGNEIGLSPMQSVQNISTVNNRPSLWGDAMLALVRSSPLCEYFIERWEGAGDLLKCVCRTKRRGEPEEQVREFTMADARQADLLSKDTYKKYGKRMIQMRARAWLIRDVYTDLIRGLHMAEEAMDIPTETFMGNVDEVRPTATPAPAPAAYPDATFQEKFPQWEKWIAGGKKSGADVIAFVESAGVPLTEMQKAKILSVKKAATPTDVQAKQQPDAERRAQDEAKERATRSQPEDPFTAPTFAQVADKIAKAKTMDQLATAGDMIRYVTDLGQQGELQHTFEAREQELRG